MSYPGASEFRSEKKQDMDFLNDEGNKGVHDIAPSTTTPGLDLILARLKAFDLALEIAKHRSISKKTEDVKKMADDIWRWANDKNND